MVHLCGRTDAAVDAFDVGAVDGEVEAETAVDSWNIISNKSRFNDEKNNEK